MTGPQPPMMGPQAPSPQMGPMPPQAPGGIDETAKQKRIAEIRAMPPGSVQQQQAIDDFSRDYGGLQSAAQDQMRYANQAINQGQPEATRTGGRFGTTVAANPLAHIASGLRSYRGYKDMAEAKDTQKKNSEMQQRARAALLRAGL